MNSKLRLILFAIIFLPQLMGCVTVVDAISDRPIEPDPGKRSFGTYLDDKNLETIVAVNIRKAHPLLADSHINVHAYNGVVLLTGEVPTGELRDKADETARSLNQIRQVYNELQVSPQPSFLDNADDTWISTKIKTKLIAYRDIDSSKVKVFVENHTVYLMGLLSHAQVEKITDVVRTTSGVHKVVRAIEYID